MRTPEKPVRLQPLLSERDKLFSRSGNQCAYTGCKELLVTVDGIKVGEICHMAGAMPGALRFDLNQTNEERRSYENLILLCRNHHARIDNWRLGYTVEKLKMMKFMHEAAVSVLLNEPSQITKQRFLDQSLEAEFELPANFKQLDLSYCPEEFFPPVKTYLAAIAKLPQLTRSFFAHALNRAVSSSSDVTVYFLPDVVARYIDEDSKEVATQIDVLRSNDLINFWTADEVADWSREDTIHFGPYCYFKGMSGDDDEVFFLQLLKKRFADEPKIILDIFENLNFSLLDSDRPAEPNELGYTA